MSVPSASFREAELTALFRAADVGLNPMLRGSGTNLKMLDYAAHGALVLSTEVGARGLGFVAGHALRFVPAGRPRRGRSMRCSRNCRRRGSTVRTAARASIVEQHFSWRAIADRIARPLVTPDAIMPRLADDASG